MKNTINALFASLIFFSSVIGLFSLVQYQPVVYAQPAAGNCTPGSGGLPLPTWYQYLPGKTTTNGCEINAKDLGGKVVILILMGVFDILLYLAGVIAVIMVIWGGFKLLTSSGEPQKIAAARTTIFNALVGLVIAIIASQIVGFIAGGLA